MLVMQALKKRRYTIDINALIKAHLQKYRQMYRHQVKTTLNQELAFSWTIIKLM